MAAKRRYAQYSTIEVSKSQSQIQELLKKYGATAFVSGYDGAAGTQAIGFTIAGFKIRFSMAMQKEVHEDRRMWRAMLLVIKAKLEAVESDISTVEKEFLAWVVTETGQTVGEMLLPQLQQLTHSSKIPKLLTA